MEPLVIWQRVEGGIVFVAALALYAFGGMAPLGAGVALLAFLAPDLSFAAYLAGPRWGARGYNLVHLYGTGLAMMALGIGVGLPPLASVGTLWLAHAGIDRLLGYGLKSARGFGFTHLGEIGRGR